MEKIRNKITINWMHWVTHTLHVAEKKIIETEYMSGGKEYSE